MTAEHESKRAGLTDVAKLAKVSIGTVSNYINMPDRVSDRLKTRIQSAIEELGYEKPRTKKDDAAVPAIGYLIADIENYLYTSIFEGAQETCENNNMEIIGVHTMGDKQKQSTLVRRLYQMHVAGLLLSALDDSQNDLAFARAAGIPTVMIDHLNHPLSADHCTVLKNDYAVGEIATNTLIEAGCTHLAYVAHSAYQPIINRQTGIEQTLKKSGIHITLSIIDSDGLNFEDGYAVGLQINDMPDNERPDGIIAGSDRLAAGLITAILDRGKLTIPNDLCVIGTEGDRIATNCPMPITIIESPGLDMGRQAMTLLLDEIHNPKGHIHTSQLLMPSLERRATTR